MKKVILIPLIATSSLFGCQDQTQSEQKVAVEAKQQVPDWVGEYSGTTPCMGCLSRCEDCPGMAVTLTLHQNQSFELHRESLSEHNGVEKLTGTLRFTDADQQQIELMQVTTRNLMFFNVKEKQLEIREDVSAKEYQMQSDFILAKQI